MPETATIDQEQDWAREMRQKKGRVLRGASKGAKTTGSTMQVAGTAGQVAMKGAEVASKGTQVAAKGGKAGGKGMMKVGGELSGTIAGSIVGIPLAIAGGAVYADSAVAGGVAKGTEKASKAGGKAAKATKNAGKKVKTIGEQIGVAAKLKAGQLADAALKKAMPTPMKIGVKAGEMVGIDVMKWLKRSIIFGFILQYVVYIGAAVLAAGIVYVSIENFLNFILRPIESLSKIL